MRVPTARFRMLAIAVAGTMALTAPSPAMTASTDAGQAPKGGSRVGVSKRVIKLGMHMPLTGASPLPSEMSTQAKDLYFRWMRAKGRKINGRRVSVVLRNDNYNPSSAVGACRELVQEEKVFALVGFVGVEQMQACARYAASEGVPYISPGTTERWMRQLSQTFATTMTWPDQGKLMADFMVTKLRARKRMNAMVWHNTGNDKGAHASFVRAMGKRDADVYSRSVSQEGNTADATAIVQELEARDVKNVYVHVTPSFYLQLLRAATQANYKPNWTAVDPRLQNESLTPPGCNNNVADGAKFFSPYPSLVDRDRFDKRFDRAMNRFYSDQEANEIHWGNWAQQKVIARLLRRPGRNLTRQRFVYFAERAHVKTGVGPRLRYRPKNHFGAREVHLNRLDCGEREWHTKKAFVSDFKRKKKR